MVYTTHFWWFWGWFMIVLTTLFSIIFHIKSVTGMAQPQFQSEASPHSIAMDRFSLSPGAAPALRSYVLVVPRGLQGRP